MSTLHIYMYLHSMSPNPFPCQKGKSTKTQYTCIYEGWLVPILDIYVFLRMVVCAILTVKFTPKLACLNIIWKDLGEFHPLNMRGEVHPSNVRGEIHPWNMKDEFHLWKLRTLINWRSEIHLSQSMLAHDVPVSTLESLVCGGGPQIVEINIVSLSVTGTQMNVH